jgi:hypothetical protein
MFSHTDFSIIADLDLDPIKVKLMHKESGEGWSLEQANAVEFEYRRFLYLMKKFPQERAAPRSDVDIFWHYHILDTMKYEQDCQAVFGYFLHHFPYIGLRGTEDLAAHQRVGERMRELYEATFGEPFMRGAVEKKTAYSTFVSAAPTGTATPRGTSGTAYSTATVSTAYSTVAVSTAYSTATASTAYSTATVGTAYSTASISAARSTGANEPAARPLAQDEGDAWDQFSSGFFTVRPTLASSVTLP